MPNIPPWLDLQGYGQGYVSIDLHTGPNPFPYMWDRHPFGAPTVFPVRACMRFTLRGRQLAGHPRCRFLLPRVQVGARVDIEIVMAPEIPKITVDRKFLVAALFPGL